MLTPIKDLTGPAAITDTFTIYNNTLNTPENICTLIRNRTITE